MKKAVHLYASGPFLGLTNERLRRTRRRLRRLPKADGGVDLVLLHLARRFTGTTGQNTRFGNRILA